MRKRNQAAALPLRLKKSGTVKILLVTSRDTGRWVLPKGWIEKGLKPHEAAAREAEEEAGVRGRIDDQAIGTFSYAKVLDRKTVQPVEVSVFPLYVCEVKDTWPEAGVRKRRWVTPEQAAELVAEPGLASIFDELDDVLGDVLERLDFEEKPPIERSLGPYPKAADPKLD